MSKKQVKSEKKITFNLRIQKELFDGLDECVRVHNSVGLKLTKNYVVEKHLFHYLMDMGFLDRKYIKTARLKFIK